MKFPRRYRNVVGFSVSIVLILTIGITAYLSINEFKKNVAWVNHTNEVIRNIESIEKLCYKAESSSRGYLISGDTAMKSILKSAVNELPGHLLTLEKLTLDNPEQVTNAALLHDLSDQKIQLAEERITQHDATGYDVRRVDLTSGRTLMDQIHDVSSRMKAIETKLLEKRNNDADRTRNIAQWLMIFGNIINVLLLALMIYNIQKAFRRKRIAEKELQKNNNELQDLILKDKQRNWILNGANEINMQMRAANTLEELTDFVVSALCKYMNTPLGAFYIREDAAHNVSLYATYGFEKKKLQYNFNDGLVGQTAADGKIKIVNDVPEGYVNVQSAFGEAKPKHIIITPIHYTDRLNGIIELAFLTEPQEVHVEFLEFISKGIGSGINTGQLIKKMNALNDRLQAQSEELQKQQEELKATNEELLSQSEALQASEEELRVQQEELQQTNAELEEKAQIMREQNAALETAGKAIREKAEELEQTSRYKSEFLANMSHELRTPLNSILILAKLLSDNKGENLNDKQIEYAKVIHKSGNDLLNLINDILDLSKIEAGKLDLTIEDVEPSEIAEDLQSLFKEVARSKKINFEIELEPEVPARIKTDKIRLEQVLRNLLSNAFKFTMPNGSIRLQVQLADKNCRFTNQALSEAPAVLMFRVSDTGIGIPKEKQHIIFEAFQQADGATTRKFGGTGLGLSISRQLSFMLGGELQLESEEGKGSTFILCIPAEADVNALQNQKRTLVSNVVDIDEEDELKDDRNNIKPEDNSILIIEDDRVSAELYQRMARQKKYKTIVALQGDLGLYYAKLYKPKAILLDVYLPVMDGFTVLKKLKEDNETAAIPVHLMSGMNELPAGKGKGRASFTTKPMSEDDIETLFEEIKKTAASDVKSILIIEDDPIHQEFLKNLIQEEEPNMQCHISKDAADALHAAEENNFDCVILDLQLPDASGIEIMQNLRAIEKLKNIPIIVYTARTVTKEEERIIQQYADTIVLKGARSQKRLMDEIGLFLSDVSSRKQADVLQIPATQTQNILTDKKVLLVDDDMRNVFALSSILHEQKLEVIVAGDGREALQKLKENADVDIVLMDIMMPEMDGYQAMQEIRKDPAKKDLPIIALTAKAMKEDREKCLNAGASDYITKPVDTDQLLSLMRVWLYSAK